MPVSTSCLRNLGVSLVLVLLLSGSGWNASPLAAQGPSGGRSVRAAPYIGANVNTTRRLQNQHENAIAVNPTNPQQVVVLSNDEGPVDAVGLVESVSSDGGKTWSTQLVATGSNNLGPACCDPSLSWDSYGNLFLEWLRIAGVNTYYAEMAYSTDGGQTLNPLGAVSDLFTRQSPPGISPITRAARANLPADQSTVTTGANSVWITYANTSDGYVYARGAPVTGLGTVGAFNAPVKLSSSLNGNFGDIAIGPNGQVMVVYQMNDNNAGPDRIMVNVDSDGLGAGSFGSQILATGTNVGGARLIPAQANNFGIDAEAGLAWDRSGGPHNGRVYLVYTDAANTTTNDTDIYLRYSDSAGASWSARKKINDDSTTNSQFLPRIALDQRTGDVAISWYDSRNDLGTGGSGDTDGIANDDAQLYATYSTDGGASFVPNFRVSAGTSNSADSEPAAACCRNLGYGDYVGLDFISGNVFPAWADNSNSTGDNPDGTLKRMDVYTARVSLFSADLSVAKLAPTSTAPGATLPFTLTVANGGPDPAMDVVLTDTLPSATTFVTITQKAGLAFACSTPAVGSSGTISCSIPLLPNGASASFSVTTNVVGADKVITNTARVVSSAADPNENNNVATTTTNSSGLWKLELPIILR